MATSSIHIQRAVQGSVGHNSREHFSYSVVFADEKNECSTNIDEAYKTYRSELKIRTDAYTDRTGQKLQKSAVTQLSAVINLEAHHTLKDLEPIKAELERLFDTKVYQMAIHRDEGKLVSKEDGTELYSGKDFFLNPEKNVLFFDKKFTKPVPMNDYEIVKNYHAHIEMMGLDSKGNAIRQKMNKVALQGLQTTVAKDLGMERGKSREGYTKKEMEQIVAVVGKKSDYENTTLYAQKFNEVAKDLGVFKESNKRKDTHQFKDDGAEREKGKRAVLATQKELKAEINTLKLQLQQVGAGRAEYAALEQLNKELKEQIKGKDIIIDQMSAQIALFNEQQQRNAETILALKKEIKEAQKEPINARMIANLQSEVEILKSTNTVLERELNETKSAPVPKGENEASRQIEKYLEEMPKPTGAPIKTDELELLRFENGAEAKEKNYQHGERYAKHILDKHTNIVGKVDKEALVAELGKEFKETAQVLNRGLILVNDFKSAYERTKSGLNNALKSTEKAFKDVFSKITGKSTEQVNEQRREAERAIQQEKIKQAEAQKAKEPEQVKAPSRGLSLGR